MTEATILQELCDRLAKMPKFDRGINWQLRNWQGSEEMTVYGETANCLKWIFDNTEALISAYLANSKPVAEAVKVKGGHSRDCEQRYHSCTCGYEARLEAVNLDEPVAWLPKRRWEQMTAAEPWLTNIVYSEDQGKFFECVPLYASTTSDDVTALRKRCAELDLEAVKVKPLQWHGDEYVGWSAYGVGLGYSIDDESSEEECFILTKHDGPSELKSAHPSIGSAQEYAQADYEQRIMSALSTPHQPEAQGDNEALKPCGIADPSTRDCPNMKEVGGGMDGERYRCAVCGKGYYLDYEEMK